MNRTSKKTVPEVGFGNCHWCGEEDTRLQYLMCPKCYRISNLLPSKAMILLNQPEIKKKLGAEGATLKNFTPELRQFIMNPENNFPAEENDQIHWQQMIQNVLQHVQQKDVKFYIEEFVTTGVYELPETDEELFQIIGLEILLRFMLRVLVEREVLRMNLDVDEDAFLDELQDECMQADVLQDQQADWRDSSPSGSTSSQEEKKGMKVRDLIMKKYGR